MLAVNYLTPVVLALVVVGVVTYLLLTVAAHYNATADAGDDGLPVTEDDNQETRARVLRFPDGAPLDFAAALAAPPAPAHIRVHLADGQSFEFAGAPAADWYICPVCNYAARPPVCTKCATPSG